MEEPSAPRAPREPLSPDALAAATRVLHGNPSFQEIVEVLGGNPAKARLAGEDALDHEAFVRDVNALRQRLRETYRGLLRPRGSFIQFWDLTTGLCLMYTLFVTTFEVGLDLPTRIDALFVCNQLTSLVFLVDICVQFFLPVPDPHKGEGAFERRHAVLARRYLLSWFALDVVTILPFDVMSLTGMLSGPVKMTKVMRVMRLFKLLKVLRSSAIIERWQSSIAISSSRLSLITYSFIAVVLLHWFACGWCLLPVLQGSQRGEPGSESLLQLAAASRQLIDAEAAGQGFFWGSHGGATPPQDLGLDCLELGGACLADDPSTQGLCDSLCLT